MKRILKLLSIVLMAALIIIAIFLIPAHIQTRRVTPNLPSIENISALQNSPDGPVRLSYVLTSSQQTSKGPLGHPVFIAQWADGRMFMVDAGMNKQGAQKFAALLQKIYGGEDAKFYGTAAELLGSKTANVQGVGFTHMHIDHTQGIDNFCTAREQNQNLPAKSYLTKLQHNKHNFNTKKGAKIIKNSCLKDGLLKDAGIMEIEKFPGLSIIKLGGHTPGSTLFIFAINGHLWILSGDIAATKTHLLGNHGKGFLYSYILVPENTSQTARLRQWLAKLDALDFASVIVSHDLNALQASGLPQH